MNTEMTSAPESTTVQPDPMRFERETCSRCGGSGSYSYCQSYGTKCFKCAGKGIVLTKRGLAAARYLKDLRSLPVSKLEPGMVVRASNMKGVGVIFDHWTTVILIEPNTLVCRSWVNNVEIPQRTDLVQMHTKSAKHGEGLHYNLAPETTFEVKQTAEQHASTLAAAIAYQATLTKTGTVRKVGKK